VRKVYFFSEEMFAGEKGNLKGVIFTNEEGNEYEEDNDWFGGGS
jgi:hypothetical protein